MPYFGLEKIHGNTLLVPPAAANLHPRRDLWHHANIMYVSVHPGFTLERQKSDARFLVVNLGTLQP